MSIIELARRSRSGPGAASTAGNATGSRAATRRRLVGAIALIVASSSAAVAFGDIIVVNDVTTKGDTTLTRGATSSAEVAVTQSNTDPSPDRGGCNVSGSEPVTVTLADNATNKVLLANTTATTDDTVTFSSGCDNPATAGTLENSRLLAYTIASTASFGTHVISTTATGGKQPGSAFNTSDALKVTVLPRAASSLQAAKDSTSPTSKINLSWTASPDTDIDGYTIYEGATAVATTTGSGSTTASISELTADSNHCYTVKARVNAGGTDLFSAATTSACARTDALPSDTTAPVITPDADGALGNGGWYTGNVTVTFAVADPDSPISSRSAGCAGGSVTADTTGTTFMCTATSLGGTTTESVTIKRDATKPVITLRAAGNGCSLPGNNGWCRGEQTAGFSASDATSGLVNAAGTALSSPHSFMKSTTTNGAAVPIPSGTIEDAAGNEAIAVNAGPFKIDSLDPSISGDASPAPNADGWNRTSVSVDFTCGAGTGSPIVSCGPDATLADEGRAQSVTGDAEDEAGNTASDTVSGIDIDKGAPTAPSASFDKAAAFTDAAGAKWFRDSVAVSYGGSSDPNLADGSAGSGIKGYSASDSRTTSGALAYSGTASDRADNESAATSGTVMVDADAPSLQVTGCPTTDVKVGAQLTLSVTAGDGAGSGLKTDPTGQVVLDTASIGSKTRQVTTEDNVGHQVSRTCAYRVIWDWSGFFQPIDGDGVLNRAKAGSAIPVKFSLDGAPVAGSNTGYGLAILASEPTTGALACSGGTSDDIEESVTTSNSGLKYDAAADQYVYVWKSASSWAGQCRQLIVKLADGTDHRANFQFVK